MTRSDRLIRLNGAGRACRSYMLKIDNIFMLFDIDVSK
jgi:hypothetical protein